MDNIWSKHTKHIFIIIIMSLYTSCPRTCTFSRYTYPSLHASSLSAIETMFLWHMHSCTFLSSTCIPTMLSKSLSNTFININYMHFNHVGYATMLFKFHAFIYDHVCSLAISSFIMSHAPNITKFVFNSYSCSHSTVIFMLFDICTCISCQLWHFGHILTCFRHDKILVSCSFHFTSMHLSSSVYTCIHRWPSLHVLCR